MNILTLNECALVAGGLRKPRVTRLRRRSASPLKRTTKSGTASPDLLKPPGSGAGAGGGSGSGSGGGSGSGSGGFGSGSGGFGSGSGGGGSGGGSGGPPPETLPAIQVVGQMPTSAVATDTPEGVIVTYYNSNGAVAYKTGAHQVHALRDNNPNNDKYVKGLPGEIGDDNGFAIFQDTQDSYNTFVTSLYGYMTNGTTVQIESSPGVFSTINVAPGQLTLAEAVDKMSPPKVNPHALGNAEKYDPNVDFSTTKLESLTFTQQEAFYDAFAAQENYGQIVPYGYDAPHNIETP